MNNEYQTELQRRHTTIVNSVIKLYNIGEKAC
jgi:hypothetical protein